jgi:hypothetical protein
MLATPRSRWFGLATLCTLAALAACSQYGPTQYITGFYVYGTDSSGTRTAIAVEYSEL